MNPTTISPDDNDIISVSSNDKQEVDGEKLNILKSIFPNKNSLELVQILKIKRNETIDELVDDIIEADNNVKDYPLDVYNLFEMIPKLSIEYINSQYEMRGCDFTSTMNDLIQYDGREIIEHEHEHEGNKTDEPYNISQLATILSAETGETESTALKYLEVNQGDLVKSLIDVVNNKPEVDSDITSKPRSRIQRIKLTKSGAKDIEVIHESDYQIRTINLGFLKKMMLVFDGDMTKVMEHAGMIIDHGYQSYTFANPGEVRGKINHLDKTIDATSSKTAAEVISVKPSGSSIAGKSKFGTLNRVGPIREGNYTPPVNHNRMNRKYLDYVAEPINNDILHKLNTTGKLDLHGLQVDEALKLVKQVVRDWWDEELNARITEGKKTYGQEAQLIEPLVIVTGRGIHSRDGYSKIKLSVNKYLSNNKFIFDEDVGRYTILGKRK